MVFDLDHWRQPRQAIATRHKNDDLAYATHGALVAMECLKRLGIGPDEAAAMRLLDYGCGTGRMARVLAGYFGRVTAYDPVKECIAEGRRECNIPQHNLDYVDDFAHLPRVTYDAAVSVNVLEHLDIKSQKVLLENLKTVIKPKAPLLLWYAIRLNRQALVEAFGEGEWVAHDEAFLTKNPTSNINVRVFRFD